jgi:CheY-like chemotaxis protein
LLFSGNSRKLGEYFRIELFQAGDFAFVSKQITVMIIDDEIHMRRLINRMLTGAGFQVIEAASGQEALNLLNSKTEKPDLITSDISMPDMDGFEILQAIKTNPELANIPIVMLTAMGQLSDANRAKEMGAVEFVTKPFSALSLIGIIRKLTDQIRQQV